MWFDLYFASHQSIEQVVGKVFRWMKNNTIIIRITISFYEILMEESIKSFAFSEDLIRKNFNSFDLDWIAISP